MDPRYALLYYYYIWCGGVLHVLSCVRMDKWTLAMCCYTITMVWWVLHVLSCVRTDKWTLAMCCYTITMVGWAVTCIILC